MHPFVVLYASRAKLEKPLTKPTGKSILDPVRSGAGAKAENSFIKTVDA
jgi:hypothetical protein